ncbi:MAG: class I SAM-dependent methyltransferase [Candidatus Korobacteraceae bacterium]
MAVIYHRIVSPSPKNVETKSAGVRAWIRDTVRARGPAGALRYYVVGGMELLRDLAPSRRRSRYGDIDYDFDHGVDTTWATIPLRTRVREWLSGGQYQPSEPALFHQIVHSLPVAPDSFSFIDLGSGKGRTLLMASDYPFRRIVGIELLDELDIVARQNISRYHGEQQKCFLLESHSGDAREFVFPHEPIVLYLFNPFPEFVLATVLANLRNSLAEIPRPVFVVYHNLVHERVLAAASSWLHPVYRTSQFAIYRAAVDA